MTGWDIDPEGVEGVLETAGERAADLEGWGTHYLETVQSAAVSAGTLNFGGPVPAEGAVGLVGQALAEFVEHTQRDVLFIGARIGKSLEGARDAAIAYLEGDAEMAADTQRLALRAPELDLRPPDQRPEGPR